MEYKYPHLFSPIKVGRLTLKNRIEAAPVNISNLPISGYPTAENIAIFEGKAKGGAAIVHMGECRIDMKTGISHKLCIALDDPEVLPYLHAATDAIKKHNAFAAVELIHPGTRANPEYYDGPIWGPSAGPGHLGKDYSELDQETIDYIVERFGDAAEMAKLGGVDEIYMVGGAQAVAALAYGTETIPRVDKITGPGNAFVAAAKQIVSGDVGIDMVAGPSEVCVLADATAKPMVVAADLMAQAEHDPLAACYLVTCDEQFAREVEAGIDVLVAQSPRAEITRASLDNEGIIVVAADMAAAVEAVNTVAPEHLELHCKDAMVLLGGIRNAGAIFVGAWSSEPLGDYVAGPNHTLPTGGTAMFSNPLSVEEFVKRSSVICYTPEGLLSDAPATQRLAEAEGLWAHALSAALRRRVLEQGEDAVSAESLAAADLTKVAWPGDAVATVAEGVDLAAASANGAGAVVEEA